MHHIIWWYTHVHTLLRTLLWEYYVSVYAYHGAVAAQAYTEKFPSGQEDCSGVQVMCSFFPPVKSRAANIEYSALGYVCLCPVLLFFLNNLRKLILKGK